MIQTTFRQLAFSVLALLILTPLAAPMANAAAVGQGLEISPPVMELKGNPGQTITTKVSVRNITDLPISARAVANDFVAKGLTGEPSVLVDGVSSGETSMRTWFSPIPDQVVAPRQLIFFPLTINIPKNASPGGHYGVIRFVTSGVGLTGGNGVSLTASVGSLLLVTVSGNVKHELALDAFTATDKHDTSHRWFQEGDITFTEKIRNLGNVHEKPVGTLIITDMFGHKTAQLAVNPLSGNVLPGSDREFSQHFKKTTIGFFKAQLFVTYANGQQLNSYNIQFLILPYKLILLILLGLVLLYIASRYISIDLGRKKRK